MKRSGTLAAARRGAITILLLALGGCAAEPATVFAGGSTNCKASTASNLPGVKIEFIGKRCVWSLAEVQEGIRIPYIVSVDAPLSGVVSLPRNAGECDMVGASGLNLLEELQGNGQYYGIRDIGLCEGLPLQARSLPHGRHEHFFQWDGRNWTGPSDYGEPKGARFPAGEYVLSVSSVGSWETPDGVVAFEVIATLPITLHE